MKIMQICFTPIVGTAGGVEKVFCNMANHFCTEHKIVNVCNDSKKGLPYYSLDKRVDFRNINKGMKIPFTIRIKSEIVRLLRKTGVKLEHPKEVWQRSIVFEALMKTIEKTEPEIVLCYDLNSLMAISQTGFSLDKCILMIHTNGELALESMNEKQIEVTKKIKYVQVLTEKYKDAFQKVGYKNVVCIGNIVPQFDDINFENKENTIVHVGRLDKKIKRQHLLIEAFAEIADMFPDWNLKLIGGDSNPENYEEELKGLIKSRDLENRVFMLGKCNNVHEELKHARIFAFPSKNEGFPLSLTEAFSCGLPAVGFEEAHGVNIFIRNGENGYLAKETMDFAEKLKVLMENKEITSMYGMRAMKEMKQYTSENVYKQWDILINSMI